VIGSNGSSVKFPLPDNIKQSVSALQDGTELILGIRPEDVNISSVPAEGGLETTYVLMEALGSENIHHLRLGALNIKARTSPADVYGDGQTLWVRFEPEGIRLFDKKTELAI
jgi:ABC-type sugar transport system ATPase subunit